MVLNPFCTNRLPYIGMNRIGGVMVGMLVSSADCRVKPKNIKLAFAASPEHTALKIKSKITCLSELAL